MYETLGCNSTVSWPWSSTWITSHESASITVRYAVLLAMKSRSDEFWCWLYHPLTILQCHARRSTCIHYSSSRMRFVMVSHERASSSAECSRDKPPFSFVRGQDSTIWDIVWVSPQGHRSVSVSCHFLLQAPQCPCSCEPLQCVKNAAVHLIFQLGPKDHVT